MVRFILTLALVAALTGGAGTAARAQNGAANTTPDRLTYLVNRDLGNERWTIGLSLVDADADAIINVTGNIFSPGGGSPQFITCQVREDSTGSLRDPSSTFRFRCKGAEACTSSARGCAQTTWAVINDDVPIAASFFLPLAGTGAAVATSSRATASTPVPAIAGTILPERPSGLAEAGATLSYDGATLLVSKDLASERWAIAVNFFPEETSSGLVRQRLQSITGNVFATNGAPPSFLYCQPRSDSTGSLQDPASTFRLRCLGASGCGSSASECAQTSWAVISEDVPLAADFLLPPDGLGDPPPPDGGLVVIGTPNDPASYPPVVAFVSDGGGCPVGAACGLRVGNCANVPGRRTNRYESRVPALSADCWASA